LRQKATAARSPALKPVATAPSAADAGPATLASLGRQLRELLPARRLHSVSLYDHQANVLWLSEGALGPDEQAVAAEALELLTADTSLQCHEMPLEDGRLALFLPVRAPHGELLGIAMILADGKVLGDDTLERMGAAPVRAIMLRLAVLLKPGDARAVSANGAALAHAAPEIVAVPTLSADGGAGVAEAGAIEPLSPERVNDILEFDLSPEDTGHVRVPPGLAEPAPTTAAADLLGLEFTTHAPPAPAVTPVHDAAPATTAASAVATTVSCASPASDPNLLLEVVPYAKLRAGGQTRRFQILARMSPAPRDPSAQDALVLQRLMTWLATHRAAWNSQPTGFTVNLSIATLEDERFAQKLAAALNSHGIAAETLGFEIAEALCTQRRAQVERFIAQCEKLGAWVVIDGFSFDSQMLPLLRSKALRLVKIDPKLTSTALKDKLSQAIVVATIQAAKVLGIHCAAQKVDSQASLQWLTAIGCDFAQGAVLGRAQSLDSIATLPESTGLTAHLRST
jgi:EAL domain-containing protein (putative c-di-GMP-specific phosphodiesterase class I)